ncbi:MAG: hypothetical protein HQL79_12000 [Magnetococcales bacterium]|nr:hypothetical protein [Magnetococcales bacterium]
MSESGRRELGLLLQLEHEERIEAEKALIQFLGHRHTITRSRTRKSDSIHRRTDWVRSLAESPTPTPLHYWRQKEIILPDTGMLSALAQLTQRWIQELKTFPPQKTSSEQTFLQRAIALEKVLATLKLEPGPATFDTSVVFRIRRHDLGERLAELLHRQWHIMQRSFDPNKHGKSLLNFIANDCVESRNPDAALEIIATLSLLQTAARMAWKPVASTRKSWKLQEKFYMEKDGIQLQIGKGCPYRNEQDQPDDRSIPHLNILGHDARGKDPDIWIKFFSSINNKKTISIIGDAKRNAQSKVTYISDPFWAMVNYLVAYGHYFSVSLGSGKGDFFTGPIQPAAILFFKQMPSHPEIKPSGSPHPIIQGLSFEEYDRKSTQESTSETKLDSLFKSIEKQVRAYFDTMG